MLHHTPKQYFHRESEKTSSHVLKSSATILQFLLEEGEKSRDPQEDDMHTENEKKSESIRRDNVSTTSMIEKNNHPKTSPFHPWTESDLTPNPVMYPSDFALPTPRNFQPLVAVAQEDAVVITPIERNKIQHESIASTGDPLISRNKQAAEPGGVDWIITVD
jgi:hypothetical protein